MPGNSTVQSVERSLAILRHIAEAEDGLGLQPLAAAVGLKPTTVHNLARTLLTAGFLSQTRAPVRYRLGPALGELTALQQRSALLRAAAESLRRLARELPHATLTFSQLRGTEVCVALRLSPQQPGVLERPAHRTLSPYSSASSVAVLAFGTDDTAAACRRVYPFEEYGRPRWASRLQLDKALAQARQLGYVQFTDSELLLLAVPVQPAGGELAGLLGVAVPLGRVQSRVAVAQKALAATAAIAAAAAAPPQPSTEGT